VEAPRLVVIQDMPTSALQQQPDDPYQPKEKPNEKDKGSDVSKISPLIPKKPKTNRIIGPSLNKPPDTTENKLTQKTDSINKINKNITGNPKDTLKPVAYKFPVDSSNNFTDDNVGLHLIYYKDWKKIDMGNGRILLRDNTPDNDPKALYVWINPETNVDVKELMNSGFKDFELDDTTKYTTALNKEPFDDPGTGHKNYEFYVFGKVYKLSIRAQIKKEFFDENKNYIEATVRSMRIK